MNPRLVDLDARFIEHVEGGGVRLRDGLAGAHGIRFLCPKCYVDNGGSVGTHCVLIWFANRGAPDHARPLERWEMRGNGANDLTCNPSIRFVGGCQWHGFIVNGCASIL